MILRLSSSAARGAIVLFAAIVFLFLSYSSIRNARAASQATKNTKTGFQRAAQLEPGNPEYWYLLGRFWQYNLDEPDPEKAIQSYRTSLSFDPHDGGTWAELATAYELEGDVSSAQESFLRAKQAYPLSAEVAWRYGNFLLRQGRTDEAFREIHHAVEADPRRGAEAFSRSFRVEPNIDVILSKVLPPSSAIYVDILRDLAADNQMDNALRVWDHLAALNPRLSMQDSYSLVNVLLQRKDPVQALRIWDQAANFSGLSQLRSPNSLIWDGGFEYGQSGPAFAWFYNPNLNGVQIAPDSNEKHSGSRSLRIMFDGKANIRFSDVCTNVVVQPATNYHFSAWIKTAGLTTEQGVRFQLAQAAPEGFSIKYTAEIHDTRPWTRLEIPWTSGNDTNLARICLARDQSEQANGDIQGTAWLDDVALVPDSTGTPHP